MASELVNQKCIHGHEWRAGMYSELGGWFYFVEGEEYCPVCQEPDILNISGGDAA